jgi:hypothetical protein
MENILSIIELEQEIINLDLESKLYLADSLFKNIEESVSEDYEQEWLDLAESRLKEIEQGKAKLISSQEVFRILEEIKSN